MNHAGNLLGKGHSLLLLHVDDRSVGNGELGQMHATNLCFAASLVQVAVQTVGIVWCYGCHEAGNGLQTGEQGLIGRQLVLSHLATPETLLGQAHKPVADIIHNEGLDETSGTCGFVVLVALLHVADEGVQRTEYPTIHLGTLCHGYLFLGKMPSVHIGIHGQERITLIQLAEETA